MILTLTTPSSVTAPVVSGGKEDTATGSMMENVCYKQLRFYLSMCPINNRVYYFFGPIIMGSQLRTCFVEHIHCIALC